MRDKSFRPVHFAQTRTLGERRADDSMLLRSDMELDSYAPKIGVWLDFWAKQAPDRIFLTEPRVQSTAIAQTTTLAWAEQDSEHDGGRLLLRYGPTLRLVRNLAGNLLQHDLSADRPLVILSGNSLDHALLSLAAQYVGIPVVPVSPAWSLLSPDAPRIDDLLTLVWPGLVYASDALQYAAALSHARRYDFERLVLHNNQDGDLTLEQMLQDNGNEFAVDAAAAAVTPDTVAKILLTSGSTDLPKGVLTTQRMLCANQQMIAQVWPFIDEISPILVDWLPWNHCFGGNHNFNLVLRAGGTLHIDDGQPTAAHIGQTVANLRRFPSTIYFNVPAGFAALLPYLEDDKSLAATFFERLQVVFYAAAALPQDLWERMQAVAMKTIGQRIVFASGWGSTETAPAAATIHRPTMQPDLVGRPLPGVELKLLTNGDRLEVRVRGPNVTPGYYRQPSLTATSFDQEGFYCIGDAMRLADPNNPDSGLIFDGRVAEDFKLLSGTWVRAGALRIEVLTACKGLLLDTLITGHDRAWVGMAAWPDLSIWQRRFRTLYPGAPLPSNTDLLLDPKIRQELAANLNHHNQEAIGSSRQIIRLVLLTDPARADIGEITDKGYINQRISLQERAAAILHLYTDPVPDDVLVLM